MPLISKEYPNIFFRKSLFFLWLQIIFSIQIISISPISFTFTYFISILFPIVTSSSVVSSKFIIGSIVIPKYLAILLSAAILEFILDKPYEIFIFFVHFGHFWLFLNKICSFYGPFYCKLDGKKLVYPKRCPGLKITMEINWYSDIKRTYVSACHTFCSRSQVCSCHVRSSRSYLYSQRSANSTQELSFPQSSHSVRPPSSSHTSSALLLYSFPLILSIRHLLFPPHSKANSPPPLKTASKQ